MMARNHNAPKVTVVIPAYNVDAYIREAVESALSQDPPVFRVVVIDDGSTDRTAEVVSEFDDPRLVYKYQTNSGLGPARNAGLDLVDCGYVIFLDADDVLVCGLMRYLCSKLADAKLDAIVFSALDFDHATGDLCPSSVYFRWPLVGAFDSGSDLVFETLRSGGGPACAFLYAFSVDVVRRGSGLRFLPILHEDEVFTSALFMRCGPVVVSNDVFYRRRVRPGSIMTSKAGIRNVAGYLAAAKWWCELASVVALDRQALAKRQAARLYGRAVLYASRAGLRAADFRRLAMDAVPEFVRFVGFDMAASLLSRRLGQLLISLRSMLIWRP